MAESSNIITIHSIETIHKLAFKDIIKHSYELAEDIFKQTGKKKYDPNYEKELNKLIFEILCEKIKLLEDLTKD